MFKPKHLQPFTTTLLKSLDFPDDWVCAKSGGEWNLYHPSILDRNITITNHGLVVMEEGRLRFFYQKEFTRHDWRVLKKRLTQVTRYHQSRLEAARIDAMQSLKWDSGHQ